MQAYPNDPGQLPDLEKFDALVKERLAKLKTKRGSRSERNRRLQAHRIAHHQLDRRGEALRLRRSPQARQRGGPEQPEHDDHLSEAPPRSCWKRISKKPNNRCHSPNLAKANREQGEGDAKEKKPAKNGTKAPNHPATKARATRRTARKARAATGKTQGQIRGKEGREGCRKRPDAIPMKRPKNAPGESSRKTRISKKARSHPGGASSARGKRLVTS